MKEIGDWIEGTYLNFAVQENKDPRSISNDFFYKGTFFLMFMKFSLVVST